MLVFVANIGTHGIQFEMKSMTKIMCLVFKKAKNKLSGPVIQNIWKPPKKYSRVSQ